MIKITQPRDLTRLRRIALSAQGLVQAEPYGSGLVGTRNAISHLGYVQIDSISVVERAHHHVIQSRVPKFKPAMTNQLLLEGHIFEYWAHAAAFLPMADYRFSLPYKQAIKSGQVHWYKQPDHKLMAELLARIATEGPLRSRDLDKNTAKRSGWWDWKPAKKALEQLYMHGDLMVCDRQGFQKAYDLTERVLPSNMNCQIPTTQELACHLVDQQLRCHGLVSLKGLTYQRRNTDLRKAVKELINQRLAEGALEQVELSTGEQFFLEAGVLERPLPRVSNRMLILSPFDNTVIQRDRLKALFQFDYQIECYVPAAKRQFGYFSLPLLFRGEFIGRMDCKTHRKTHHLEIKFLHFEKTIFNRDRFDQETVLNALLKAIREFCLFQQCTSVSLTSAEPRKISQSLNRQLESLM